MMENITIASPLVLFLFVPIFLFLIMPFVRRREGITIPDKRSIPPQHSIKIFILQAIRTGLLLAALSGIILTLAGLSREKTSVRFEYSTEESRDIVAVLDASQSMSDPLEQDYLEMYGGAPYWANDPKNGGLPQVFTLAKDIVIQIVCERSYDRFGLIVFGSDAYLARTFTNSCDEFKRALRGDLKDADSLFRQYSNSTEIANALNEADHMFSGADTGRSRAVLLISDMGDPNMAGIIDKISTLLSHDVLVYIFAVNPHPDVTPFLERTFMHEERVHIYKIFTKRDLFEAKRSLDILQPVPHMVARTFVTRQKSTDAIVLLLVGVSFAVWACAQPLIKKIH